MQLCVDAGGSITGEPGVRSRQDRLYADDLRRGLAQHYALVSGRVFNPTVSVTRSRGDPSSTDVAASIARGSPLNRAPFSTCGEPEDGGCAVLFPRLQYRRGELRLVG
jgi:hypothetical protein